MVVFNAHSGAYKISRHSWLYCWHIMLRWLPDSNYSTTFTQYQPLCLRGETFLVWIAIKSRRKIHMTLYLQEGKSSNGQFTGKPVSVCCQVSFSYCWFWTFWPLTEQNSKHQTASVSAYRQKCLLGFCTTLWLVIRHVWAAEKRPGCRYHKCHTLLIVHQ